MAYESMTYESILNRLMKRVEDSYPNLDNREGSIIFNALAPAALELAIAYTEIDNALSESFVRTATREYLLEACLQMGMDISMFEAKAGVHKGQFNVEVDIGSRWNCDLYNYEVIEYKGLEDGFHTYELLCETVGSSPNNTKGKLTAIDSSTIGLETAELVECIIEGENETPDDNIRNAYFNYINNSNGEGNTNQYKLWCDEYPGIGNSKIFPLWNGDNTVKVSILTASNRAVDTSIENNLVKQFQEYLDPGTTGMGDGVAPIGAFVTVTTATEKEILTYGTITLTSGYSADVVRKNITEALTKYFSEIAYNKGIIPYLNVGATVLAVEGVDSVTGLEIGYIDADGETVKSTADITLDVEEIPVLGTQTWVVTSIE